MKERAGDGYDPETGTRFEKSGRVHRIGDHSTTITSEAKYVQAEKNLRKSEEFRRLESSLRENDDRVIVEIPLKQALGENYEKYVSGYTRPSSISLRDSNGDFIQVNHDQLSKTDFYDGNLIGVYIRSSPQEKWKLLTMYPNPK